MQTNWSLSDQIMWYCDIYMTISPGHSMIWLRVSWIRPAPPAQSPRCCPWSSRPTERSPPRQRSFSSLRPSPSLWSPACQAAGPLRLWGWCWDSSSCCWTLHGRPVLLFVAETEDDEGRRKDLRWPPSDPPSYLRTRETWGLGDFYGSNRREGVASKIRKDKDLL